MVRNHHILVDVFGAFICGLEFVCLEHRFPLLAVLVFLDFPQERLDLGDVVLFLKHTFISKGFLSVFLSFLFDNPDRIVLLLNKPLFLNGFENNNYVVGQHSAYFVRLDAV